MPARPPNPPGMFCKACLYDLAGTAAEPGRSTYACPECGRAFDPRKPKTTLRQPLTARQRFWSRPPYVVACVFVLLGLYGLWACRQPGGGFFTVVGLLLLGTPLGVWWVVRSAVVLVRSPHKAHHRHRLGTLCWNTPWIALLGVTLLLQLGVPGHLAWYASQSSMEHQAKRWLAQHAGATSRIELARDQRSCLITADVAVHGQGVFFRTGGFINSQGFAYFPNHRPGQPLPTPPDSRYTLRPHHDTGWFRYSFDPF